MKSGIIPASWFPMHPARRMDARYWLLVLEHMKEHGISPEHATPEQVREAIAAIEARAKAELAEAARLSGEAIVLRKQAAQLRASAKKLT